MKTQIEIDTKTFVRFWLVVIGFILAFYLIYSAATALIIIGSALFIALVLSKPVHWLANLLPGKSWVGGIAVAYVSIIVAIGLFFLLVVPPIVQQTVKSADTIPSVITDLTQRYDGLRLFVSEYNLQEHLDHAIDSAKSNISGVAARLGSDFIGGISSFLSFLTAMFLTLVLSFLMLIEGKKWLNRLWGAYNNQARMEDHKRLVLSMHDAVNGYVTGQLTVSGIGALSTGLVVFIIALLFNEPINLALSAAGITFILSLIPMFGATISGIIITLLLSVNSLTAGIVFLVYFLIYQQLENNFISPVIQSKRNRLSALTILISVTIGLYLFGLIGGIISIPIAGCINVLVEDYMNRAKQNREKNQTGIQKLTRIVKGGSKK